MCYILLETYRKRMKSAPAAPENGMKTIVYIYTVILKVFEKSITPEQALELIGEIIKTGL